MHIVSGMAVIYNSYELTDIITICHQQLITLQINDFKIKAMKRGSISFLLNPHIYHTAMPMNFKNRQDSLYRENSDTWFNIISWEKSSNSVHDTLPPAIIILLQHINHRTLLEAKFIFFVSIVVVDCHH